MAKSKGEMVGIMVMEAGYGSAIPACVVVHLNKTGAAVKSGLLNVGDHIISINGVSLVGMPIKSCIEEIKVFITVCMYKKIHVTVSSEMSFIKCCEIGGVFSTCCCGYHYCAARPEVSARLQCP